MEYLNKKENREDYQQNIKIKIGRVDYQYNLYKIKYEFRNW